MGKWTADGYNHWTADGFNGWTADGFQPSPPVPPAPPAPLPNPYVPPANPYLQSVLRSYLYVEYQDDDDLQAFVAAYNAAAQTYLDWFATVALPVYTGLSSPLLGWVGDGLYGIEKTALASPLTPATGELNTVALNTTALNSGAPASETYYAITDDVFQRILTWNLYKGDGKRFTVLWLKRRIARFLFGVNGVDPNPFNNPDFVVGAENTQAISVTVSAHVLTVTVNQGLLSTQTQITPGILQILKLAFLSGQLELPLQYTYAFNINTSLVAIAAPTTQQIAGIASTLTTSGTVAIAYAGSGDYTYAWSWQSGGTGISIDSPSTYGTTFTATGLSAGQDRSGVAQCVVTDVVTSQTATVLVNVNIECATAVAVSVNPPNFTLNGATPAIGTGIAVATPSGGIAPYTFAWTWQSGGANIQINQATSAVASFASFALPAGTTATGVALCTVTDSFGQTATDTCAVTINRVSLVTAIATPASVSVTGASEAEATEYTNIAPSGGQLPYTYSWGWKTGGSPTISNPTSFRTYFYYNTLSPGQSVGGMAQCTVKDAYGQVTTVLVPVGITRVTAVSATVSPTSLSSNSPSPVQTTAVTTAHPTGGSGSYTYNWIWSSGGAGIDINSPHAAGTSFTASGMVQGHTYSGIAQCTIMDGYEQIARVTVAVFDDLSQLEETMRRLYTNNANSSLAAGISSGATSLSLVTGGGALFPNPNSSLEQNFTATLVQNGNPSIFEIILVEQRATDTFSLIARAQEGTTARSWSAGDVVNGYPTAGDMQQCVQPDDLQEQQGNFAFDTGVANAYVVNLSPALLSHQTGMPIRWKAAHGSTGPCTFSDGVGVGPLFYPTGAQVGAASGLTNTGINTNVIYTTIWDGSAFRLQAPDLTIFLNAASAAGIYAPLISPGFGGIPTGPTAAPGTLTTQLATCDFATLAGQESYTGGTIGSVTWPNGYIENYGVLTTPGSSPVSVAFHTPFTTEIDTVDVWCLNTYQELFVAYPYSSLSQFTLGFGASGLQVGWRASGY